MRAKRPCSTLGCASLVDAGTQRCPNCSLEHERARGTATQRGYGKAHKAARRKAARTVIGTPCARCSQPILTGEAWHLDHTTDRTSYLGPSHASCNLAAAGRARHGVGG